jgi:hypothetical protein
MTKLFKVLVFLAVMSGSMSIQADSSCPNDCMVIATIAHARLQQAGVKTRIIAISGIVYHDELDQMLEEHGVFYGHALTLYEVDGVLFVYDSQGSRELEAKPGDPVLKIVAEIIAGKTALPFTLLRVEVLP